MSSIAPEDRRSEAVARDIAVKRISAAGLGIAAILGLDGLRAEVALGLGQALRDLDAAIAALVTVAFTEELASPNNVATCQHCDEQLHVAARHHPLRVAERSERDGERSFVIIGGSTLLHQCLIPDALGTPVAAAVTAPRIHFDD